MKKLLSMAVITVSLLVMSCQKDLDQVKQGPTSKQSSSISIEATGYPSKNNGRVKNPLLESTANARSSFYQWRQFFGPPDGWVDVGVATRLYGVSGNGNVYMAGGYVTDSKFDPAQISWRQTKWLDQNGTPQYINLGSCGNARIDVDDWGDIFMVDCSGNVYFSVGYFIDAFQVVKATGIIARDISVSADGQVWAIGGPNNAGNQVYRLNFNSSGVYNWVPVSAPAPVHNISVDRNGNALVGSGSGGVWKYNGSGWTQLGDPAIRVADVGIGLEYFPHLADALSRPGSNTLWVWTNGGWRQIYSRSEFTRRVDADGGGYVYMVDYQGRMYTY